MSVYLDRFLNVPATRLPKPAQGADPEALLGELPRLLDRQQQVDEAGQLVASYLGAGGDPDRLVAALGACLLREDRNFHTIQCVEAAVRQHELLLGTGDAGCRSIAAARYLAAHAPTARSQRQTYEIARRLHRGERIYEDDELASAIVSRGAGRWALRRLLAARPPALRRSSAPRAARTSSGIGIELALVVPRLLIARL